MDKIRVYEESVQDAIRRMVFFGETYDQVSRDVLRDLENCGPTQGRCLPQGENEEAACGYGGSSAKQPVIHSAKGTYGAPKGANP